MKSRRGMTLIELMLSMGAGSMVMLLAITLVHQSMQFSKHSMERFETSQALSRLARIFREDVHSAVRIESTDNGLLLFLPYNRRIEYRALETQVTRQLSEPDKPLVNEYYLLKESMAATFSLEKNNREDNASSSDPPRIASLIVAHSTGLLESPQRVELSVLAGVGRWVEQQTKARRGVE